MSSKGWARSPGSSDRSLSSVALLFHNKGFACSSFFFVPLFSKGSRPLGKYLVLGVLRRLALTFRPGELHPRALDYQQATPHGQVLRRVGVPLKNVDYCFQSSKG